MKLISDVLGVSAELGRHHLVRKLLTSFSSWMAFYVMMDEGLWAFRNRFPMEDSHCLERKRSD